MAVRGGEGGMSMLGTAGRVKSRDRARAVVYGDRGWSVPGWGSRKERSISVGAAVGSKGWMVGGGAAGPKMGPWIGPRGDGSEEGWDGGMESAA